MALFILSKAAYSNKTNEVGSGAAIASHLAGDLYVGRPLLVPRVGPSAGNTSRTSNRIVDTTRSGPVAWMS
jgi:hypothetical protein